MHRSYATDSHARVALFKGTSDRTTHVSDERAKLRVLLLLLIINYYYYYYYILQSADIRYKNMYR